MTFAADPQLNESYPLGELSYAIVISETADWNRMPDVEETFLRRLVCDAFLGRVSWIAYFGLSALA